MAKILLAIERVSMAIAVVCIALIMLVISFDAVGRYALHSPLQWAFQLITYYVMGGALYLAISSTFTHGDHVRIDLFRSKVPKRVLAWSDATWCLISAAAFALIAYGSWQALAEAFSADEFLPGNITWPAWVAFAPILFGSAVAALRLAYQSYDLVTQGEEHASLHDLPEGH